MGRTSNFTCILTLVACVSLFRSSTAMANAPTTQLSIDRVDLMPIEPAPFKLKDFKAVARGYDRLVFDFNAKGDNLPLIWWDETRVNMPDRAVGLPSYVGKKGAGQGNDHEAITVLGSLLGATVAGIDKTSGEHNWVATAPAYFNSANGQNVVINNVSAETGKTYWYETFPQILFNCLADRYPNAPRLTEIMRTSADRWHDAYTALAASPGGLNFEHTAFDLRTMKPVDNGKWHEPDGAAGIAWIQYSAYRKFGDKKYLDAADALMTCLERRDSNPVYEIDLPFGAYVAARLNAEHGHNHDVGQLLNWCFDPSTNRSGWGVIVGKWGDYECSGMAGSVTDGGGYAFVMNTYAMGSCLVPLVRYDDRYARAIGKWMLNAMNSVRLCYQDELPPDLQSCPDWKSNPPNVISYEGLRKRAKGKSPYAQGDPLVAGWGKTDLGLYGGGFVGIFAGIIAPTDDAMIPQLDLLATDFFRADAYPTYLYYNPYDDSRTITISVGEQPKDVYDAVRDTFVARNAAGLVKVKLDPDGAAILVLAPAGGKVSFDGAKTSVDDVVIDYNNGRVAHPTPAARPARKDESKPVLADRATIAVDGDPKEWLPLASEPMQLDTGGRGRLTCDVRFAWDDQFLYVLARQTAPTSDVHEASNVTEYSAAIWDFDGVWLYLDLANSKLPSIGDFVTSFAFGSTSARDLFYAPAAPDSGSARIHTATSGTAAAGNRVIEARIAWTGLIEHAFNGNKDLASRFGQIRSGLRFGCDPALLELNHKHQSFIGGAQYKKPTGSDANSRDLVLLDSGGKR